MFKFEKSILIQRPVHEVFKYVANPGNMHFWRTDVIEAKFGSLPLKVGDKVEEIINFVGQQTSEVEVVEVIPDSKLTFKVVEGHTYLPLRVLSFREEGENTLFTAEVSVHTDGFSRMIEPISSNMFSIKWETYLFQLKKALEQQAE